MCELHRCSLAAAGNLGSLRAAVEEGGDVDGGDYDRRRPIHIAASEGRLEAVRALVEELGAEHSPQDRWGLTPLDDALRQPTSESHRRVAEYLIGMGAIQRAQADGQRPRGACAEEPPADAGASSSRGRGGARVGLFSLRTRRHAKKVPAPPEGSSLPPSRDSAEDLHS